LIELSNVWKSYGAIDVLRGVNLTVGEGDFISIRGKSGAGKTTLLKIIGLLDAPDKGEVKIFGRSVNGLSDDERSELRLRYIGFIFQFFNLIPSLTVLENVELPLALAGVGWRERRKRALDLLEYFGLAGLAWRFPNTLSGGERQRVAIIRALSNNPKIILADEPTSSIDDENSQLLMNLLTEINRGRKVTIILTTTDLYEKLPANRSFLLRDGRLIEC
jgi:putative ABC transport system ATP-binding protein